MAAEGGFFQWCGGWVFGGGKQHDFSFFSFFLFFFLIWVSRSGGGWSLWGVVAVYAWKNLEWV